MLMGKLVCSFTYLRSIVSNDIKLDKEIESRIGKPCSTFGKLYHRIWKSHDLSLQVKFGVYKSDVKTTLLYDTESCSESTSTNLMLFICDA